MKGASMDSGKKTVVGKIPVPGGGVVRMVVKDTPSQIVSLLDRMVPRVAGIPDGIGFEFLKGHSPFPVKQKDFPKEIPEGYPEEHPCSDGGTIWIPVTTEDLMITHLLHETGHCLLHFPDGPDINLEDPEMRTNPMGSKMESEACAVAYLVSKALGLPDHYNRLYLDNWTGSLDRFRQESESRVLEAATRLINLYSNAGGR